MTWQKTIGSALREIRFVVSGLNSSSAPVSQFLRTNYQIVRQQSPNLPFIIRECEGVEDFVVFQYDYGVERKATLKNLGQEEIEKIVQAHVDQAKSINSSI